MSPAQLAAICRGPAAAARWRWRRRWPKPRARLRACARERARRVAARAHARTNWQSRARVTVTQTHAMGRRERAHGRWPSSAFEQTPAASPLATHSKQQPSEKKKKKKKHKNQSLRSRSLLAASSQKKQETELARRQKHECSMRVGACCLPRPLAADQLEERRKGASSKRRRRAAAEMASKQKKLISMLPALLLLLLLLLLLVAASASGLQLQQSSANSLAQMLQVFNGAANDSQQQAADPNHFKLIELADQNSLLLGARNVVYNLSRSSMREQRRLEWPPSEEDARMCRVKGKSANQCQNYIRVLKLLDPSTLIVCGTNAYKPRCRRYLIGDAAYELQVETPGEGSCPYQENQNVTSTVADGELFSGSAAHFDGIDGLIHRQPLRTEQFNPKQLNSPNFVSSFRYGEHVYFLFREIAVEHLNCGKTIYSRIARVCINDLGGQSRSARERWTSFVKARLNCSIPGDFPFYFDEIQASTHVLSSAYANAAPLGAAPSSKSAPDLVYAVFTTPTNSIGGSAICAFRMDEVKRAFEGPFRSQSDSNSLWLPVQDSRVPRPRPGSCSATPTRLPDELSSFLKETSLMDQAVEPIWSQPLITMASINFRLTQLAVDTQVETGLAHGAPLMRTDVIFAATDDGRVFKLVNNFHLFSWPASYRVLTGSQLQQQQQQQQQQQAPELIPLESQSPFAPVASRPLALSAAQKPFEPVVDVSSHAIILEELHLFDSRTPIVNLELVRPSGQLAAAKLLVLSSRQLKAIPLSRCERAHTCADCLALLDPYCAWNNQIGACQPLGRSLPPRPPTASSPHYFPPNQSNSTLAWWHSCAAADGDQPAAPASVGPPFRSLFSSHLQVPSRFDYQSGHHLARASLIVTPQQTPASSQFVSRQPVSECLTFCGGAAQMAPVGHASNCDASTLAAPSAGAGPMHQLCADYLQQQPQLARPAGFYSTESVYLAVIVCAIVSIFLGFLFGFAIARNQHKHADSSICSSTFDETNLYMASTGSHGLATSQLTNGALFANKHPGQHYNPLAAPLRPLQHNAQAHPFLTANTNAFGHRPNAIANQQQQQQNTYMDVAQCLLSSQANTNNAANSQADNQSQTYGNQQQLLMQLGTISTTANNNNNTNSLLNHRNQHQHHNSSSSSGGCNSSGRLGALPPLPLPPHQQQQSHLPLINSTATQINQAQLTPPIHNQPPSSGSSASSASSSNANNSSLSGAIMPNGTEQQQQFYLQQQIAKANGKFSQLSSGGANPNFLQQQLDNKSYL